MLKTNRLIYHYKKRLTRDYINGVEEIDQVLITRATGKMSFNQRS